MRFISRLLLLSGRWSVVDAFGCCWAFVGMLFCAGLNASSPPASTWVWVEDDFEGVPFVGWSSSPAQGSGNAPMVQDGAGVGGSKALAVTVEAGDCFVSKQILRESTEGAFSFWFHPNGVSIPSDSGYFLGNTFRVAGVMGGDLWYAVAVLRMRQQDGVYKGFLEYRASDGAVIYDYPEGEFDFLNTWQKITISYRIGVSISVMRNDSIVRELAVSGHAVDRATVMVLGKSYLYSGILPQGQLLYDDVSLRVPCIPDLYVDGQSGDDGATGQSPSDALKTIQRAADKSGPGTSVHIFPGIYNERLVVPYSGAADAWVEYVGGGFGDIILDGAGIPINYGDGLVQITGLSFVRLRNLNVRNSTGSGINAYGSTHVEILGNTTLDTHSSGIKVRDCENVLVSGNRVRRAVNGGSEECITISSCTDFEVSHNSVTDGVGLYEGGEGICVKGNSRHGSVHHNSVHDLPKDFDPEVHEAGEVGIYIGAHTVGMILSDVEVYSNTTSAPIGIAVSSELGGHTDKVRIFNNLVHDCYYAGIEISNWIVPHTGPKTDVWIVNNTVFRCGRDVGGVLSGSGIYIESVHPDDAGFIVMNNILSGNRQYQIRVREAAMPRTTLMNNLIHGPVGPLPEGVAGAAPVFGDPLFASPPADFSLMSGSPALKEGLGVDWILTDYFGRPMRQPPDLGAIQYLAPNNPPVLIPAGNRSVRADETIRIEIQAQDADGDPLDLSASGE